MAKGQKTGGRVPGSISANRKAFLDSMSTVVGVKELVQAQADLARGIFVEVKEKDSTGETVKRVYRKEPDQKAGQYLLDQYAGKASQAIVVSEDPESPLDPSKYLRTAE